MKKINKIFWGFMAVISTLWYQHYTTVGNYYANIFPKMQYALYFCETWRNISIILLILSLTMIVR